jgi:DnaD/phage-associated family protein
MPQANGEFVKVYLYLLRNLSCKSNAISVPDMADIFNQTEADIMRALRYWDKTGAIILNFNDSGRELTGITFCNLNIDEVPHPSTKARHTRTAVSGSAAVPNIEPELPKSAPMDYVAVGSEGTTTPITMEIKSPPVHTKTTYTPQQIKELSAQDDFSMLLYAVGAYMGGTLNSSEASCIAYFYDALHFPSDLIEYLIEYCVTKGHKSMRYIEKVALAWAEAGISTVKDAKREVSSHNEITYSVMNAFGINNRDLGQRERDYINKWTDSYCYDTDIIIEACNRTLKSTHQPSFEYADSILSKWKSASVKSLGDVEKVDAEFEQTRNVKKSSNVVTKNTNRFNNFHQRNTDINSLESSLISNNG